MSTAPAAVTTAPVTAPAAPASAPPSTAGAISAPPPPATSTSQTATAPTSPAGDWVAGIADAGLRDYVTTKGFKDPAMVADSYRNLEKLVGVPQDKLLKFPDALRDDKGVLTPEARAVFEKLGAPKDPKDYGLKSDAGADQKRLEGFLKTAHDIGLTPWQVEALNKMDTDYMGGLKGQADAARQDQFKADDAAIRREWGAAYDQERVFAQEGQKKMGWDNAKVDKISAALGHGETMRLLNSLGKATGEASYIRGQVPDRVNTPATAAAKLQELIKTPGFYNRLENGDLEARRLWNKYNEEAAAGIAG